MDSGQCFVYRANLFKTILFRPRILLVEIYSKTKLYFLVNNTKGTATLNSNGTTNVNGKGTVNLNFNGTVSIDDSGNAKLNRSLIGKYSAFND